MYQWWDPPKSDFYETNSLQKLFKKVQSLDSLSTMYDVTLRAERFPFEVIFTSISLSYELRNPSCP